MCSSTVLESKVAEFNVLAQWKIIKMHSASGTIYTGLCPPQDEETKAARACELTCFG